MGDPSGLVFNAGQGDAGSCAGFVGKPRSRRGSAHQIANDFLDGLGRRGGMWLWEHAGAPFNRSGTPAC